MIGSEKREYLYGEFGEEGHCSRMIRDQQFKLIYYPVGNIFHLFDLHNDPDEMINLSHDTDYQDNFHKLKVKLVEELYGSDLMWLEGGELTGESARKYNSAPNRALSLTRGHQWPVPPVNPKGDMAFFPEISDDWDGSV